MRILMKPIDMIAWFTQDGFATPIKFRFSDNDEIYRVVRVSKVIKRRQEKLAGNLMTVFTCQSIIEGVERIYELKYELNSCRWFLFKM